MLAMIAYILLRLRERLQGHSHAFRIEALVVSYVAVDDVATLHAYA